MRSANSQSIISITDFAPAGREREREMGGIAAICACEGRVLHFQTLTFSPLSSFGSFSLLFQPHLHLVGCYPFLLATCNFQLYNCQLATCKYKKVVKTVVQEQKLAFSKLVAGEGQSCNCLKMNYEYWGFTDDMSRHNTSK